MAARIAHFTDLHFTEDPRRVAFRDLLSKRLLGWANLRFRGRYRAFENTPAIVNAFLKDIDRFEADALVFTGDVTGLALDSEFRSAKACLEPILEDSRVLGIPGNHDVYVRQAEREGLFEQHFPSWVRSDSGRGSRYPLLRLVGDDVAIVALKDSRACAAYDSSGRVPNEQLSALEAIVRLPEVSGRVLILALHYCVRLADGNRDTRLHRLRNDREVVQLAAELGFRLILCGHVHHRMVHRAGEVIPIHLANPGALTFEGRSCAYHWIDVEDGEISLSARRYDSSQGVFVAWEDAPGVGRLAG